MNNYQRHKQLQYLLSIYYKQKKKWVDPFICSNSFASYSNFIYNKYLTCKSQVSQLRLKTTEQESQERIWIQLSQTLVIIKLIFF